MSTSMPYNGQIPPYAFIVLVLAAGFSTLEPEQVAQLGACLGLAEAVARLIKAGPES